MGERQSVLRLDVIVDLDDLRIGAQTRLLIDGVESLAGVFPEGVGADPDEVIGPFSSLRPGGEPHYAELMRCGCGSAVCNSLVASVRRVGDDVVWRDFRMGLLDDPERLSAIDIEDVRFNMADYIAELDRAHIDRSWELPYRTTGRMVREALLAAAAELEAIGYTFEKTWHFEVDNAGVSDRSRWRSLVSRLGRRPGPRSGRGLGIYFQESGVSGRRQIMLAFDNDAPDPTARSDEIVKTILASPPDAWPVAFRGDWVPTG